MKTRFFTLLALIIFFAANNYSFAHILNRSAGSVEENFHEPSEVINIYLKAVSRGELIVFEQKLESSMITPVRVEYVYELNSSLPIVKVYSKIKQPMPVPNQKNCKIRGVSAILNKDGHIIEVEIHILAE